jgi:large subunit ribosomal protein L9
MARTVELLLTETVESLGIVGDVVKVRTGYARNFLLPNDLATTPSEEKIKALAAKRADAEREQRELRAQREALVKRLEGVEVTIQRSCNDLGQLYGSVSQQDIADALGTQGYGVKARDVRLPHGIKRIDSYMVPVKLDSDLEAEVKVWVVADRELNLDEREELEFDEEGNVVNKPGRSRREAKEAPAPEAEEKPAKGKKRDAEEAEPKAEKKSRKKAE